MGRRVCSGERHAGDGCADDAGRPRRFLPICGPDNRLQGIITDRDSVVKCLAEGRDPKTTTAGDLTQGKSVWVDADDSEVLRLMEEHQIRRLPVIEEHRLVGMSAKRIWPRTCRRPRSPSSPTGSTRHRRACSRSSGGTGRNLTDQATLPATGA